VLAALRQLAERLTPSPLVDLPATAVLLRQDLAGWERVAPLPRRTWTRGRQAGPICSASWRPGRRLTARRHGGALRCPRRQRPARRYRPRDDRGLAVGQPGAGLVRHPPAADRRRKDRRVRRHALLQNQTAWTGVDPRDLTCALAALAGYYTDAARLPDPVGLPTLRAFQRAHARTVLPGLCERLHQGDGRGNRYSLRSPGRRRPGPEPEGRRSAGAGQGPGPLTVHCVQANFHVEGWR